MVSAVLPLYLVYTLGLTPLQFGVLAAAPGHFDAVFVVSFCAALVGLGILTLFVENPRRAEPAAEPEPEPAKNPVSIRAAARLLVAPRFRTLVVVGCLLGLA